MLKIPVIKGNINRALKQFKKKFRDTQVLKELRERKNYTKKSYDCLSIRGILSKLKTQGNAERHQACFFG